ncbi:MAG: hypothetical protein E3J72_22035 [Planctomycetota bacterium]|nr:MAG: hypothetical protein E3J72_22035 [Planctomycetota bacterium]
MHTRIPFGVVITVFLTISLAFFACPGCGGNGKSSGSGGIASTGTGTGNGGNPGNAVPRDYTWAVEVSASQSDLEALSERIQGFASGIWNATEGQMYFRNQTLKGSGNAEIYFTHVDLNDKYNPNGTGGMTQPHRAGGFTMWIPAGCTLANFLHEIGHGEFGKDGEEYYCTTCVMGGGDMRPDDWQKYCDKTTCTVGGTAQAYCWEDCILKKFPAWTHTNNAPGGQPACTVDIQ